MVRRAMTTPLRPIEEVEAVTIGPVGRLPGGKVVIVAYDPAWPGLFDREAERIRRILGERVRLLEHVGSTSIPGLAAKPRIDMVLAVPDSTDEPGYVPDMESGGYVLKLRERDWFEHRLFKGPDADINLHTFTVGCPEIDKMLLFRDWLRTHPDERALYERTKLALASRRWEITQHYADAKTDVVEAILARAGWRPPEPSRA
jgi:GrpB-like predicted nucleotidyltransferase (UPF0157 family)